MIYIPFYLTGCLASYIFYRSFIKKTRQDFGYRDGWTKRDRKAGLISALGSWVSLYVIFIVSTFRADKKKGDQPASW
jgi:uncharacterized membrane protein